MKNLNNVSLRDQLIQMPTQQLDVLLEEELAKDPVDDATVRLILSILEEREGCQEEKTSAAALAAWEKYLASTECLRDENDRTSKTGWSWALKAASLVLVFGLLLTLVPQEVQAETFLQRLFHWTDSIFEVFTPGCENTNRVEYIFKTDHPGLQQVYDAVCELGVSDPIVPMWLPEGYELTEFRQMTASQKNSVVSSFSNGESLLVFTINIWAKDVPLEFHKDASEVQVFEKAGVIHNIVSNEEKRTVVWFSDNVTCMLVVDLEEDTLYRIIDSIYILEED